MKQFINNTNTILADTILADTIRKAAGNASQPLMLLIEHLFATEWHFSPRSSAQQNDDDRFGETIINFTDGEGDLSVVIEDGVFYINYCIACTCGETITFDDHSSISDFKLGLAKARLSARLGKMSREYIGAHGHAPRIRVITISYNRLSVDFEFDETQSKHEAWDLIENLGLLKPCLTQTGFLTLTSPNKGKTIHYNWFYGE